MLDWVDPRTGRTALHPACTNFLLSRIQTIELLLSFVGAVNPRHHFTVQPITAPPVLVQMLTVACQHWDLYRALYLPTQISRSVPELLHDLVELIVDYAC